MRVTCTQGEANIVRGLQWTDTEGTTWEVVRPVGHTVGHGPNGTPTFACARVAGPMLYQDLLEPDGTLVMCGDGIAAAVLAGRVPPWADLATAPQDGTLVWLLIEHTNIQRAPIAERDQWLSISRGRWIDRRRCSWQWAGPDGKPVGWRAMAAG